MSYKKIITELEEKLLGYKNDCLSIDEEKRKNAHYCLANLEEIINRVFAITGPLINQAKTLMTVMEGLIEATKQLQ